MPKKVAGFFLWAAELGVFWCKNGFRVTVRVTVRVTKTQKKQA